MYNPQRMGEYNTVAEAISSKNQIIGAAKIEAIDYMCQSLAGCSIASTGNSVAANGANIDMVLTPSGSDHANYILTHAIPGGAVSDTIVAVTPGYDVLWVAGIACGAMNFASTVTTDTGETYAAGATTIHTDTKDANLVFSVGDVIQELDNTVIGTITAISARTGADVDLTVDRSVGDGQTLADGVKVYHRNPITLELSFEY